MRKSGLSSLVATIAVICGLLYVTGILPSIQDEQPTTASADGGQPAPDAAPAEPIPDSGGGFDVSSWVSDTVDVMIESVEGGSAGEQSATAGDWTVDIAATREALAGLEVKGKAPKTDYSRSQFGRAWDDDVPVKFGNNGCDTRSDILVRDLAERTMRDECIVESGTLQGPYTGDTIAYVRDRVPDVDIDHRVALSNAWETGAQQWSEDKRLAFANDPRNLVAVDASANRQKGDGDAATWLPPHKPYRCTYVATQVAVKSEYSLWVTPAERDAISQVLDKC